MSRVDVRASMIISKIDRIRKIMYIPMHGVNEWPGLGGGQLFEAR